MSICSTAAPDPRKAGTQLNKATGPPRRCLTVNQWCEVYGLSRSTFYDLVAQGEVKTIRLAGRTLITVEEAEAYLARAVAKSAFPST